MRIDQLTAHQQETASYCHSCGELRSEDELGTCLNCDYRICGMNGCSCRCACDDVATELIWRTDEQRDAIEKRANKHTSIPIIDPGLRDSLLRDIGRILASYPGADGHSV